MKRARTEEQISNNPPQDNESDLFSIIPVDLKTDIFLILPLKSIARLHLVSKHWSSIVLGKYFTDLFLSRFTRPRFLFTIKRPGGIQFLHSSSQENPSSDYHTVSITPYPDHYSKISPPVRGLICCQNDTKVVICNTSTSHFLTLPRIQTWRRGISTFFGYDHVNDVYKVLCMTVRKHMPRYHIGAVVSEEHQVFTLGGAQNRWRMIKCNHPHRPYPETKGICKDGVVYYLALVNQKKSIISFDLRTEDFNVIELPEAGQRAGFFRDLVKYNGKIAFVNQTDDLTDPPLWVLEDVGKQEWLKVSVSFPSLSALFVNNHLEFRGTISTGELIFAPRFAIRPYTLLCYNLKKKMVRKVVVEGLVYHYADVVKVFLGHIESPMFLSE